MPTENARLDADGQRQAQLDLAVKFQRVTKQAAAAARAAAPGRRGSAYAHVMCQNGFTDLDMDEVRRLVGE
jgi:hypothetical protein